MSTLLSKGQNPTGAWSLAPSFEAADAFSPRNYLSIEPGESKLEELLLRKLGTKGWGRFHYFRQVFSSPWGEKCRPLSPKAQKAFLRFLEEASFPAEVSPSLFITDEGHLELAWEDASGKRVEIEFGPTESEYFLQSDGTEGTVSNVDLQTFARSMVS